MAVQLIRKVRNRQPQRPLAVDLYNPLAKGIVGWWYPQSARDFLVGTGQPTTSVGKNGVASVANGTSTNYVDCLSIPSYPSTLLRFGSTNIYAFSGLGPALYSGSDARLMFRSESGANTFHLRAKSGAGWTSREFSANATNRSSTPSIQVGVARSESLLDVYWNGVKDNGTLSAAASGPPDKMSTLSIHGPSAEHSRLYSQYSSSGTAMHLLLCWSRALSDAEVAAVCANPWQVFKPETIPLFFSTVTAQYARPISDASAGTWTASSGSDLYAMLDETTASDTDYIVTNGASICEVALTSLSDPASSAGHVVRYRISADSGGITVRLRQGTTTIATWTHATAPTSLTTYEQTLTSGEADSITDYTALKLQFEAT